MPQIKLTNPFQHKELIFFENVDLEMQGDPKVRG
jgi:hypothetical protein